jgi:hypothetical protein
MFPTNLFRPLVLALVLCLMLFAIACSSCAPSNASLKGHSHAAEVLDDLALEARDTVLELRQAKLDRVAAAARADGLADAELRAAVTQAAADFDAGPAVPAVNAFVHAKDAYVRAVLAAAAQDTPRWADVRPFLADVVNAYNALRLAVGSPDKMPPIPDVIAKLLTRVDAGRDLAVIA